MNHRENSGPWSDWSIWKWKDACLCASFTNLIVCLPFIFAYALAYIHLEYTSISTNTYNLFFALIIRWIVSICTRSPAFRGYGRSTGGWYRFQGLLFLIKYLLSSVRLIEDRETLTPSFSSSLWSASAYRWCSNLFCTIFLITSSVSCFGCDLGRELCVGMGWSPSIRAFFSHFSMAVWWYPKRLPTFLALHPFKRSLTASLLIRGICLFVVYGMT